MTSKNRTPKMPVLFFGHGSPMNALDSNNYTDMLKNLAPTLPRPKAILMISAHWETQGTWITGMNRPKTIHDFFGFPEALFQVQYPAPGAPHLAESVSARIVEPKVSIDPEHWGLDHGTWTVLHHLYPEANIPVVQLSIDRNQPMEFHLKLGEKLSFLREQGVLIIGSGNIVHNLRTIDWDTFAKPLDWALEFDAWTKEKLINRDFMSLAINARDTQEGKMSIPTPEHYIPMLYTLGASDEKDNLSFLFEGMQNASISMRCIKLSA